jgi:hypothetical protein
MKLRGNEEYFPSDIMSKELLPTLVIPNPSKFD